MYTTFNHTFSSNYAASLSLSIHMQVFFGCHDDNSIDEDHEKDGQSGKFTDQKLCWSKTSSGGQERRHASASTVSCRVVVDPFDAPGDTPSKMAFCAISRHIFIANLTDCAGLLCPTFASKKRFVHGLQYALYLLRRA